MKRQTRELKASFFFTYDTWVGEGVGNYGQLFYLFAQNWQPGVPEYRSLLPSSVCVRFCDLHAWMLSSPSPYVSLVEFRSGKKGAICLCFEASNFPLSMFSFLLPLSRLQGARKAPLYQFVMSTGLEIAQREFTSPFRFSSPCDSFKSMCFFQGFPSRVFSRFRFWKLCCV